jgi:membrane protein
MPSILKPFIRLMRETVQEWAEDGASRIAAALAYYAIFSLSPLLIFIAIILGFAIDRQTLESSLIDGAEVTVGQQGAQILRSLLVNVEIDTSSIIGSIISISIVIWGASNLFTQLQHALNKIWEVRVRPGAPPVGFIINRLESFGLLAFAAFSLLGITITNMALSRLIGGTVDPSALFGTSLMRVGILPVPDGGVAVVLIRIAQAALSISALTIIIAMVFKFLPDVVIHWKDVLVGSAFTAVLLFIGQFLVGLYLSNSNVGSVFGAAGSLTAILVWIYYTAQILLFGAEFTEVWARHHGSYIRPNRYAVWLNEFQARREAERANVDFERINAKHLREVQENTEAWQNFTARTKQVASRAVKSAAATARSTNQRLRRRRQPVQSGIEVIDDLPTGIAAQASSAPVETIPEPPRRSRQKQPRPHPPARQWLRRQPRSTPQATNPAEPIND